MMQEVLIVDGLTGEERREMMDIPEPEPNPPTPPQPNLEERIAAFEAAEAEQAAAYRKGVASA